MTHHDSCLFFCLMIRRPPRSTLDRSSAASDVYKRQDYKASIKGYDKLARPQIEIKSKKNTFETTLPISGEKNVLNFTAAVSYTHLRAHETVLDLVCRLLLEKKKKTQTIDKLYLIAYDKKLTSDAISPML